LALGSVLPALAIAWVGYEHTTLAPRAIHLIAGGGALSVYRRR
jgi:hypothetical protein